ncbi:WD40/YVTN repeat-like-containing domain protein [Metarhizium album ARSEF 1941]|uniref:ASTRA-associated protein 1 n=1 Tax=Metarhizium album (strain ARSEF 1941) TaxID=1081103 RepID=A0A0B2X0H6_METAS|nr:WD40/YVTN repeat-like-containing domain protein [Metarhizium album ARSEF 1941]KHN99344.1 WD40/YVTN repeat-like-containing domain protein [Metarhizium album ARSEF 1941]
MTSPVPSPKFILRGHRAAIHAATFIRQNERLVTGDSDGFVVLWDLTVMRPRAVWRAHESAALGLRGWEDDKLITHGRDHKLIVWKIAREDESGLSTALPLDGDDVERRHPWVVHLLQVNTMNFCSFAACPSQVSTYSRFLRKCPEILIAVPNTLASESVDIYTLPSQKRIHTVKPGGRNGMVMSLSLVHLEKCLTLVAAFENGFASVHRLTPTGGWIMTYRAQAHSQPILSLDLGPDSKCFFTSGADAMVAKHPIPTAPQEMAKPFNPAERIIDEIDENPKQGDSLPSGGLKSKDAMRADDDTVLGAWKHPRRVINTKHSGQQSLEVRSDGAILATAGWDSKIRLYSCKTLRELAVLKWHKEGAYAVTFSDVGPRTDEEAHGDSEVQEADDVVDLSRLSVRDRRSHRVKAAHWVAAGAKDGKVSLWDMY